MRTTILHPDAMDGWWDAAGAATPGILDELIEIEERVERETDAYADVLIAAAQLQARRQLLSTRCPHHLRDMLSCLRTGRPTGRGARTDQNTIREIRAAVRAGNPQQREMFLFDAGGVGARPRPPTRRGRPKKSDTREKVATTRKSEEEQGVLL